VLGLMSTAPTKLRKLVILDRIILLDSQWAELRSLAEEIVEYNGLDQQEILRRLAESAADAPAPFCWTELAKEEMTLEQLNDRIRGADGVITCWTNIPDAVILANPQLRYLGFWTNLVEHRVNLELARDRGIRVTYIPDYGTDSVAEMTFAGLLAVSRRLLEAAHNTRRGSWDYELLKTGKRIPTLEQIPQRSLAGKKLGLLGFGRIGQRVAEMARAFRMDVAYWSRESRPSWEAQNVGRMEIDTLFEWVDVLSVHLSPYAPAKIVSRERLALLHDGAIFVNTAAGRLVDQEALWAELSSGRLHAYVDVYETLPPRKLIPDLTAKGNVFTYRAGWFTLEAITLKGERMLENLRRHLGHVM
jgi:lactate dehydrogenase-like 2-hydroxyacid dehydrogenase